MDGNEQRGARGRHGRVTGLQERWRAVSARLQRPRDRVAAAALAIALVAAVVVGLLSLFGSNTTRSALPPTPPSPSTGSLTPGTSVPSPPSSHQPVKPLHCSTPGLSGFGGSVPNQICIPSLRVDAAVMQLGLNQDRTVQVPPLSRVGDAGWYKYSAAPGNAGPTVILGHVDSAQYGAGVFYRLGTLRTGDKVVVSRGDGKVATFRVSRVQEVSKTRFPTDAVYGRTSSSAIRLVTCGGRFNSSTGNYEDNIIAYGTLLSLR